MLGSGFATLWGVPTRPTPIAAVSTTVRIRPVTRETSVATAMVPAVRMMPLLPPGVPSRAATSSPGDSTVPRGTGGRDVITCVSSSIGPQLLRACGGGGGGRRYGGGSGGRDETPP